MNAKITDPKVSSRIIVGHFAALTHLITSLGQEKDPDRFLEHVGRMIQNQTGCDRVSFWIKNEQGEMEHLAAFFENRLFPPYSTGTSLKRSARHCIDDPMWRDIARAGAACIEGDFQTNPPVARIAGAPDSPWIPIADEPLEDDMRETIEEYRSSGMLSTLSVPLVNSGDFRGKLNIFFSKHREFGHDELELIKVLAHQAMLVIQIMRLSRQSRTAAVLEERNRMARDIHDTLAQGFTGVIIQLQAARGATGLGDVEKAALHIQRAEDLARVSLGEARRSVRALRARSLRDQSLCDAIEDLIKLMSHSTSIEGKFRLVGALRPLSEDIEEGLLRITQEAFTNTLKHAEATRFQATLTFGDAGVELRLLDDGKGFVENVLTEGLGLIGMRERAERIGAAFTLRSEQGVEIVVSISDQSSEGNPHAN